jgi:hypothetical protein
MTDGESSRRRRKWGEVVGFRFRNRSSAGLVISWVAGIEPASCAEPTLNCLCACVKCQHPCAARALHSGGLNCQFMASLDAELQRVIAAWDGLPVAILKGDGGTDWVSIVRQAFHQPCQLGTTAGAIGRLLNFLAGVTKLCIAGARVALKRRGVERPIGSHLPIPWQDQISASLLVPSFTRQRKSCGDPVERR